MINVNFFLLNCKRNEAQNKEERTQNKRETKHIAKKNQSSALVSDQQIGVHVITC